MKILPARRWMRWLTLLVVFLLYCALMWWTVFPWVDRTFVNRPAFDGGAVPSLEVSPQPSGSVSPP